MIRVLSFFQLTLSFIIRPSPSSSSDKSVRSTEEEEALCVHSITLFLRLAALGVRAVPASVPALGFGCPSLIVPAVQPSVTHGLVLAGRSACSAPSALSRHKTNEYEDA